LASDIKTYLDRIAPYLDQAQRSVGLGLQRAGYSLWARGTPDSTTRAMGATQQTPRVGGPGISARATRGTEKAAATSRRGLGIQDPRLGGSAYNWAQKQWARPTTRFAQYRDYDRMDAESPELGVSLDVTVANMVASEEGDEITFSAGSEDANLQRIMDGVNERTRLREHAAQHAREQKKYGDVFLEVVYDAGGNVWDLNPLSAYSMHRVHDDTGQLVRYEQRDAGNQVVGEPWEPWEVVHLRNNPPLGHKYGRSQLWRARKPYKILATLEDALAVMVLTRAPQRLVHTIEVPDDEAEATEFVEDYKVDNTRRLGWDSSRDTLSADHNPLNLGDIIVPLKMGVEHFKNLGVKALDGQVSWPTEVHEIFWRKILIATQVPPAYLGIETDVGSKARQLYQEIEFGRMIRRSQASLAQYYKRDVYGLQFRLALRGRPIPEDAYYVEFPKPSKVDERVKAEIVKLQAEVAGIIGEKFNVPLDLILIHFFNWDETVAQELAQAAGVPSTESEDLNRRKQDQVLSSIRDRLDGSAKLSDLLERMAFAADYLLEAQDPVRA